VTLLHPKPFVALCRLTTFAMQDGGGVSPLQESSTHCFFCVALRPENGHLLYADSAFLALCARKHRMSRSFLSVVIPACGVATPHRRKKERMKSFATTLMRVK
jgi:hypothetical protein